MASRRRSHRRDDVLLSRHRRGARQGNIRARPGIGSEHRVSDRRRLYRHHDRGRCPRRPPRSETAYDGMSTVGTIARPWRRRRPLFLRSWWVWFWLVMGLLVLGIALFGP